MGEYSELLQNAALDLEQLKKTIEFVRQGQHCTFEEALREMDYVNIWDKAIECLAAAKEALSRIQFSVKPQ